MTRLSVIIPGYNNPNAYWKRCLDSVLAACGPDDEIICVDDGSACRPKVEVEGRGRQRIKWIFLEKNQGQSAARNCALDMAQGEWVTFVDSDDAVCPDVYTKCFEAIAETPQTDIVVFGVRGIWVRERMTRLDRMPSEYFGCLTASAARRIYDNRLFEYVWNKMFRRSLLENNQIRFDVDACPGEDTIFNLQCALARAKWLMVDTIGYKYYRMDGTSLSRYLPKRSESLKKKAMLWRVYADKHGDAKEDLTDLYSFNESAQVAVTWDNLWRKDSPVSLVGRWHWLKANRKLFSSLPIYIFTKQLLLSVIRRYFYFSWVYKLHIKRFYPDFEGFKSENEL